MNFQGGHKKSQNGRNSPSNSETHQIIHFFDQKRKINADQQIKSFDKHPKKGTSNQQQSQWLYDDAKNL